MNKGLKFAGFLAGVYAASIGIGSIVLKRNSTNQAQRPRVVATSQPPQPSLADREPTLFTEIRRRTPRRDGREVYSYNGTNTGHTPQTIAGTFNDWDFGDNDDHANLDVAQVRDCNTGNPLTEIGEGQEVCVTPLRTRPEARTLALLVNNDAEEQRHRGNIRNAYRTLRASGIDPCNIYFVSETDRNSDCRSFISPVNYSLDREGIDTALAQISFKLQRNRDTLLIYATGHGEEGVIPLREFESLPYSDLRTKVEQLEPKLVIAISDLCYGGAIVQEFRQSQRRVITMSPTTAELTTVCSFFTPHFWDGIRSNRMDVDGNGITSLREAFFRANLIYADIEHRGIHEPTQIQLRSADVNIRRIALDQGLVIEPELFATTGGIYDTTLDGRLIRESNQAQQIQPQRLVDLGSLELTATNYEREVVQSQIPVVVDVYTAWCPACEFLAGEIDKIRPRYTGRVKFTKINYESSGAEETIKRHTPVEIRGYPTIIMFLPATATEGPGYGRLDTEGHVPTASVLERSIERVFNLRR